VEIFTWYLLFESIGMGPNFLEYPQYRFHDRIEGNSHFQPNRRCRFCDRTFEGWIIGFFCSFARICLDNLEPIVVETFDW